MAKITWGPIVAQAIGSIGGVVFTNSFQGPYIRAYTAPLQPGTAAQKRIRGALTATAKTFSHNLTPDQLLTWQNLSVRNFLTDRFGNQTMLTPQQWFTRLNHGLLSAGLPIMLSAPASLDILTPAAMTAEQQASSPFHFILDMDVAPGPTLYTEIHASSVRNIAAVRPQSRSGIISTIPPSIPPPYDVTAAWLARFGIAAAPGTIHFSATFVNSTNGVRGKGVSRPMALNTSVG